MHLMDEMVGRGIVEFPGFMQSLENMLLPKVFQLFLKNVTL